MAAATAVDADSLLASLAGSAAEIVQATGAPTALVVAEEKEIRSRPPGADFK